MSAQSMSLFKITDELLAVQNELIENGGELTDELERRLDQLQMKRLEKVDGIMWVVQNMTRMAEGIKAEEKRLKELRQSRENTAARLREYLLREMAALDEKKLSTPNFEVTRAKSGKFSIKPLDPDKPPEQFSVEVPAKMAFDYTLAEEFVKRKYADLVGVKIDKEAGLLIEKKEYLRVR